MTEQKEIKLTAEQRGIVDGLIQLQDHSIDSAGRIKSDAAFARSLNMSDSKWNLIKSGKYWDMVDNPDAIFLQLKRGLNQLRTKNMLADRFGAAQFIEFDAFAAMFSAVQECLVKPIGNVARCCVFLAETGGGKSMCASELLRRFEDVITVDARDRWMESKFVALRDICHAANISLDHLYTTSDMEDALEDLFSGGRYILAIDEAESLGKGILNSLKRLINRTRLVVAIFAIKEAYERWNKRYPYESKQIKSRTHIVIDNDIITTADAERFLAQYEWLGVERTRAGMLLAKTATEFGSMRFICRVLSTFHQHQTITLNELQMSIASNRKAMSL